jgi:hypothetical protein
MTAQAFTHICADDLRVSATGRYSVKVAGRWLDKFNAKRGVYEVVEFRTKAAAEKAARARLAYLRSMFSDTSA